MVSSSQDTGWAPETVWTLRRSGNSLASVQVEPRFLGPPARSVVCVRLSYPGSLCLRRNAESKGKVGLALNLSTIP
jgi:hypothetical protein